MSALIHLSTAVACIHPGLSTAIRSAGGTIVEAINGTEARIFTDDEESAGPNRILVRRDRAARVIGSQGRPPILALASESDRFAGGVIVAIASRPEHPAGAAPATLALTALATRIAAHDVTVLIAGPTGTGKEVLARFIHAASPRRAAPFVAVNCAALPEAMLEALLFGHERGAFTGAGASAPGLFRAAHHGTLLLDEIAELPLGLQAKLLRVLQEREVLSIGATSPVAIDTRIIATANRDLAAEVAAGRFRADLFYRLAVLPLTTVALADRPQDVVPIAASLWLRQGGEAWPSPAALAALEAHQWPGNVRELSNILQRALVIGDGKTIERRDVVFDPPPHVPDGPHSLVGQVRDSEFAVIRRALDECHGRKLDTARRLGISERTLRYKLAAMAVGTPRGTGATLQ